jgi:hypothetical protein
MGEKIATEMCSSVVSEGRNVSTTRLKRHRDTLRYLSTIKSAANKRINRRRKCSRIEKLVQGVTRKMRCERITGAEGRNG